jgi:Diacylglycerol kinase accessory domain
MAICDVHWEACPFGVAQVECDGRELVLPRDTEGLIIMNIPSYMGGVDLWASGRPAPAAITAAGFTDAGPQSMSDQRLEVRSCSL